MKEPTKYIVSTVNKDRSISKKMLASFRRSKSFTDKREAMAHRNEMNESKWAEITRSVGRWVVINDKTGKVVTR